MDHEYWSFSDQQRARTRIVARRHHQAVAGPATGRLHCAATALCDAVAADFFIARRLALLGASPFPPDFLVLASASGAPQRHANRCHHGRAPPSARIAARHAGHGGAGGRAGAAGAGAGAGGLSALRGIGRALCACQSAFAARRRSGLELADHDASCACNPSLGAAGADRQQFRRGFDGLGSAVWHFCRSATGTCRFFWSQLFLPAQGCRLGPRRAAAIFIQACPDGFTTRTHASRGAGARKVCDWRPCPLASLAQCVRRKCFCHCPDGAGVVAHRAHPARILARGRGLPIRLAGAADVRLYGRMAVPR